MDGMTADSPDDIEFTLQGLIDAGIISADWQAEQAETLRRLSALHRSATPDEHSLSDVLIDMRDEERF
jgi:hypothetical protein